MWTNDTSSPQFWLNIRRIKKKQAHSAASLAGVASGIGEYGISNALWRLEAILNNQASEAKIQANKLENP